MSIAMLCSNMHSLMGRQLVEASVFAASLWVSAVAVAEETEGTPALAQQPQSQAAAPSVLVSEPLPDETPPAPPTPAPELPAAAMPPPWLPLAPGTTFALPPSPSDTPLVAASVSTAGLGALLMLVGAITLTQASAGEYCGATGCTERVDQSIVNAGASLIGAGAGGLVAGGLGALVFTSAPVTGSKGRQSEPVMLTGLSLTAFGLTAFGVGWGQAATYDSDFDDLSTAWPWFLTSGLGLAAGVPMFLVGAQRDFGVAPRRPAETMTHSSLGMAISGSILVGLAGVANLVGTGFVLADVLGDGALGGYGAIVIGPMLGGGSALLSAVGTPLMVLGLRREPTAGTAEQPLAALPELRFGPTGMNVAWSLP